MQRFKTAVNTVMADIQDAKSRKAFEEIKKTEEVYTERVLERIGLFDKNKNDIKVLLQRTEKFKDVVNYFNMNEPLKDNKNIIKLKKTLNLLEKILLKYHGLFRYIQDRSVMELLPTIIKRHFYDLNNYLDLNYDNIIVKQTIIDINNLLQTFMSFLIHRLKINDIKQLKNHYSDYMKILKYIIIILKITNNIKNYVNFITYKDSIIKNSISSQSLNSSSSKKTNILKLLNENNEDSYISLKKVKKLFKTNNKQYKYIKKELELFNKDNKRIDRIKHMFKLLYDLILRNRILFQYTKNKIKSILSTKQLNSLYISVNKLFKTIERKEITIAILKKLYNITSKFTKIFNENEEEEEEESESEEDDNENNSLITIKFIPNLKIKDLNKGYKDYKNYLRYKNIIRDIDYKLESIVKYSKEDIDDYKYIKSKSIMTPKSSNRSYNSSYKKSNPLENSLVFSDLSMEIPNTIKSSPKDVTDFGEKKIYT